MARFARSKGLFGIFAFAVVTMAFGAALVGRGIFGSVAHRGDDRRRSFSAPMRAVAMPVPSADCSLELSLALHQMTQTKGDLAKEALELRSGVAAKDVVMEVDTQRIRELIFAELVKEGGASADTSLFTTELVYLVGQEDANTIIGSYDSLGHLPQCAIGSS